MGRKVIGVIPARFSSERLPGKPLLLIHGQAMIWHVYFRALKARVLDRLIVATDDERIFKKVKEFGGEVCLTSSKHLSGTDRVAEVCSRQDLKSSDLIVNIQGDEPLLKGRMIDQLVEPFFKEKDLVMSTLIHKASRKEVKDENVVKVVFDHRHYALYFSRSLLPTYRLRSGEESYWKHLGFYAYTYEFLKRFTSLLPGKLEKIEKLEQLRALEYGCKIKVVETAFDTISVDTRRDLYRVRRFLGKRR